MNITADIPTTCNTAWGFWSTLNERAEAAWAIALPAIAQRTGCEPDAVRAFLDSSHGRHFADGVRDQMSAGRALEDAVTRVIDHWMQWKIGKLVEDQHGIPRALPYLKGFVIHYGIVEEQ